MKKLKQALSIAPIFLLTLFCIQARERTCNRDFVGGIDQYPDMGRH